MLITTLFLLATPLWEQPDKRVHFETEAKIDFVLSVIPFYAPIPTSHAIGYTFAMCMAPGVAKEILDEYQYGGADHEDLIADAAGCAVGITAGALLGWSLRFVVVPQSDSIQLTWKF